MAENKNFLLESFKNRQSEKNTLASREALRLVNLYRSLSYFNPEFVEKYNQMLLGSSPAVRRLLHTFMGGEEVKDYLDFLQQNSHLSDTTPDQKQTSGNQMMTGYLPQPDSDIGLTRNNEGSFSVSEAEWEKLKQEQRVLQERLQLLLKEVENTKQKGSGFSQRPVSYTPSSNKNYSEIIEEGAEDKSYE